MDVATRNALIQQLGEAMSDISEDCYCAGWLGGTEFMVPELCRRAVESGETQYWGYGEVTPDQAHYLVELAGRIGRWADTDYASVGYDPFQPFPIPPEYVEAIEREQSSLYARSRRTGAAEPGVVPDRRPLK
jgi:hypothetical protein